MYGVGEGAKAILRNRQASQFLIEAVKSQSTEARDIITELVHHGEPLLVA